MELGYEVTYVRNFTDVDDKVKILNHIICGFELFLPIHYVIACTSPMHTCFVGSNSDNGSIIVMRLLNF